MRLIDTHSHIYEPEFDADRDEVVARAREAGVGRLLFPAIDGASHGRMLEACRRYGDYCLPMMGLHPTSVNDNPRWREELEEVAALLKSPPAGIRFVGVGEIGLDLYWSAAFRDEQIEAFRRQCRLALEYDLPIAVHTRSAWAEMEQVVGEFRGCGLRGGFHAFGEDEATYRRLRALGDFRFGIGGVVTFKKSLLAETVRRMALEDLVLETDCPYLTPIPFRGKRNESGYIVYICERVAELKGLTPEEVARTTSRTAEELFGLAPAEDTNDKTERDNE